MNAAWVIEEATLQRWSDFVDNNIDNQMVRDRKSRNVDRNNIDLSKMNIWKVFIGCQITTLSKSGPNTPVSRFFKSDSPALDYKSCSSSSSVERLLKRELSSAGLRFAPTRASNLTQILELLEDGEWEILLQHLQTLERKTTKNKERRVVEYLQYQQYPGLGPKQARNFIQWLGLSRYEVPLDSRVLKKLKEFGCSFVPRSNALSDEVVYQFVQSLIQQVAKELNIYPCILDACIFSSFDEAG